MPPFSETTELYRNANGACAALTYSATAKGHRLSLHGLPDGSLSIRFLDVEAARLTWNVMRLRLRVAGYTPFASKVA